MMPIQANPPITVAQLKEAEANVDLVTELTVNSSAQIMLATDVGQNDNRLTRQSFARWIAGSGLGEAGEKLVVDIPSVAQETTPAGTDEILLQTAGGLRRISRTNYLAGVTGVTNLGHTVNGNTSITITSSSGTDATINVATSVTTGFLSAADHAAFTAKLGSGDVNLGTVTPAATTVTIVNSAGANAVLPAATPSLAGVLTAADKAKLDGVAAGANAYTHPNHSGPVTSTGDGATAISVDAIATTHVQANAITLAKVQQIAANTLLGNATAGLANAAAINAAAIPSGTGAADDEMIGFNAAGQMIKNLVSDITIAENRKNIQNNLGNVGAGTLIIDFDDPAPTNTGDVKYMRLTGNPALDIRGTRPGSYELWFQQDGTGGKQPTVISPMNPQSMPQLNPADNSWSMWRLILAPDGSWHW